MRKLTLVLLIGLVCLLGVTPALGVNTWNSLEDYEKATGEEIAKFSEAPELRTKVAADLLPPVEERLPEEPVVVEPLEEIGQYGGTWYHYDWSVAGAFLIHARAESTLRLANLKTIIPNIAKGWKFSDDDKTFTLYLRKGLRWSDGAPFTADDYLFWYEDIALNKELSPRVPGWLEPGGKLLTVEKVDDYTISYHSSVPNPTIIYTFARDAWVSTCAPAHFLKKYHPKYNEKADDLAIEKGFEHWYQLFPRYMDQWSLKEPGSPTVFPWMLTEAGTEKGTYERNPYFWKVDTEGNQLPYIDNLDVRFMTSMDMFFLKVMSGEVDLANHALTLKDYALYIENEEKGDYRTSLWKSVRGSEGAIFLNFTSEDTVLRDIFRNVRFRRALSLAIDRDAINKSVFYGVATPRQVTVVPESLYFEPEFASAYAEYDPQAANQLLDEMGLTDRDKDGFRLRPDGTTLTIVLSNESGQAQYLPMCELIKETWEKVGIKILIRTVGGELEGLTYKANKTEARIQYVNTTTDESFIGNVINNQFVPLSTSPSRKWWWYYESKGDKGEEPPQEIKEVIGWLEDMLIAGEEERIQLGKQVLASQAENLWVIGTVGMAPLPCVVKNSMRNVPEEAYTGFATWWENMYVPAQFFKK